MFTIILKLFLVSLISIAMAIIMRLIDKRTKLLKMSLFTKQLIAGVIFGIISILGTVFGVQTESGAIINVRDAAPIISGLVFGGPAGIISGIMGGVYRFVSVYWGGSGAFTQIACSVSTIMAGIFTALVRKFIFDGHHGKWYYAGILALMCEVFHMLMIFITHMRNIVPAYEVVKLCVVPMITVNMVAVMLALIGVALVSREPLLDLTKPSSIRTIIQTGLTIVLLVAYLFISLFSYSALKSTAKTSSQTLLETNVYDTVLEINDSIDREARTNTELGKKYIDANINTLSIDSIFIYLMTAYGFSEVNFIDENNFIVRSTVPEYEPNENSDTGFDMSSGEQSNEFSCLLGDTTIYVQEYQPISKDSEISMKYSGARLKNNKYDYSYVQFGYDTESYHELMADKINNATANRHVGNNGYLLVFDEDGKVVSKNVDAYVSDTDDVSKIVLNTFTEKEIGDEEKVNVYYYCEYHEGFYIIAIVSQEEADMDSNISILLLMLAEIFIFIFVYFLIYIALKHNVVDSISRINQSLGKISSGDLNVIVEENKSYEFKSLSTDINQTVDTLKGYIEKEAKKIEEEMNLAKAIQSSALPTTFPVCKEFDIYASMEPAKTVGGDFYDFYYVDDKHFAIEIADVSGKGVPAAMFMMQSKQIIRSLVENGYSASNAFTEANKKLCEGNDMQMFVTAWLGIVDLETGVIRFANAGHNPPVIRHGDGNYEYLACRPGFILAGMDITHYKEQEYQLLPGDEILLYTDGVTEAMNSSKELFGEERLLESLNKCFLLKAGETIERVKKDISSFVLDNEQTDDITMLSFKYYGVKNNIIVKEASLDEIPNIIDFISEYLEKYDFDSKGMMQISVAMDEILSNISHYGYPDKIGNVKVTVDYLDNSAIITFTDNGVPYNPLEKEDPDIKASAENRQIGGLGIFMVKKTMDELKYEFKNSRNILKIYKKNNR